MDKADKELYKDLIKWVRLAIAEPSFKVIIANQRSKEPKGEYATILASSSSSIGVAASVSKEVLFDYATSGEDITPAELQGSVYWYDTGLEANEEAVYYSTDDAYAYWFDGSDWLISLVADVGLSPANKFVDIGLVPSSVSMSECGLAGWNRVWGRISDYGGKPRYQYNPQDSGSPVITWSAGENRWLITTIGGFAFTAYSNPATSYLPPSSGWVNEVASGGASVPVLEVLSTSPDELAGLGTFSGILSIGETDAVRTIGAAQCTLREVIVRLEFNRGDASDYMRRVMHYLATNESNEFLFGKGMSIFPPVSYSTVTDTDGRGEVSSSQMDLRVHCSAEYLEQINPIESAPVTALQS